MRITAVGAKVNSALAKVEIEGRNNEHSCECGQNRTGSQGYQDSELRGVVSVSAGLPQAPPPQTTTPFQPFKYANIPTEVRDSLERHSQFAGRVIRDGFNLA